MVDHMNALPANGVRGRAPHGYRWRRALLVCLLTLSTGVIGLLVPRLTGATLARMEIEEPRDYAWFIGDLIERHITVELTPGFVLDEEALPEPGELNHWLELADVELRPAGGAYRISLVYRVTNRPEADPSRTIPGFKLYSKRGNRRVPADVPEWSFTQAPVLPAAVVEFPGADDVRADRPPPLAPWSAHFVRTAMLGLAVFVLALYLFYCHFGAVWLARWRRPFTAALHDLRHEPDTPWAEGGEAQQLERLHAAINEAAGRVVLNDDLELFLRECPLYAPERDGLAALFARSRSVFFADRAGDGTAMSRQELLGLCRRLSVLELSAP
jgi:hypothetical protein